MKDLSLLGLRATLGGYIAAHGAQKLFGSLDGPGLEGAAQGFEHMGLRPGPQMAALAGTAEFGGGILTAAGLGGPIGPIAVGASMAVATLTAHWRKPMLGSAGGPEQALTNLAGALLLATTGPGRISFDRLFRVRVPKTLVALTLAGAGALSAYAVSLNRAATQEQPKPRDENPAEITIDDQHADVSVSA